MYPVFDMDCFLAGQESIRSRVADAEKTDEFVARRCTHDFLYLFSFIGYWDMKRGPQSFGSGGKQHILQGTPSRGKVVERTLLCGFSRGTVNWR